MIDKKGRARKIPYNSYGRELEILLEERFMSLDDATTQLRVFKVFESLNRSTLYRWCTTPKENSPRAFYALEILKNTPKISAPKEMVRGWIERLQNCDERLRVMRREVQEVIAQLTFHQQ